MSGAHATQDVSHTCVGPLYVFIIPITITILALPASCLHFFIPTARDQGGVCVTLGHVAAGCTRPTVHRKCCLQPFGN